MQNNIAAGQGFAQNGAYNSKNYNQAPPPQSGVSVDGVPENQLAAYIGKNSYKIIGKFIKIQQTGSKVAWCWPPFVWGLFFGPVGVMIWLLYRKMYKNGCIAGAIGVAISTVSSVLSSIWGIGSGVYTELENYFDKFIDSQNSNSEEFWSFMASKQTVVSISYSALVNLVGLAIAILAGIFGTYLYKNHVIKSIKKFTPLSNEPGYLTYGLASVGGTSAGAAILGLISVTVANSIITNVVELIAELIRG